MCGINVVVGRDTSAIGTMSKATAHRGPDAAGIYEAPNVTLAHNRLSIIDLSKEANQPMKTPGGELAIVFNGEIYNFQSLRQRLHNKWEFKTRGDTEVLLAAYQEWGRDMMRHVEGMFAFAIWDDREQALFMARDRIGVKPLFFTKKDDVLYVSSELRAIIRGSKINLVSPDSLALYMGIRYVPGPDTMVAGIDKLPPGHSGWYQKGELIIERYWTPEVPSKTSISSDTVRDTVASAVKRQLVSDRPVGVFLSGGFDSTAVTYHAAQEIQNLKTYTSRFELEGVDVKKYNVDADRADMTAAIFGTTHQSCTITPNDVVEYLEDSFLALDEPVANTTTVSQYLLSKWMREDGVVVALGGDGGDELFAGYERHRLALAAHYYQSAPKFLRSFVARAHHKFHKLNVPLGPDFHTQLMCLKPNQYNSVVSGLSIQSSVHNVFTKAYSKGHIRQLHSLDQFMRADRETWLVDESLAHTDAMSMIHGLEIRVPLLDESLLQLTDSLPGTAKCTMFTGKKLIRDAYQGILPDYLYEGPKMGWFPPGAKWLRDSRIATYAHEVLSNGYYDGLSKYIDWDEARSMFDAHMGGSYHLNPLWNLLLIQVWARRNQVRC